MSVVYREICAVFLHPYKPYVLSLHVSVMNVLCREISSVFVDPYKTYVMCLEVCVMNLYIWKYVLFSTSVLNKRTECKTQFNECCIWENKFCIPTYVLYLEGREMNVVNREISALFLHTFFV
jgi:hypothetical protein